MNTITYSLKESQTDSEMYYSSVAAFTDKVLSKAKKLLQPAVDLYKANYIKSESFYDEEYFLELLIMGVYWKTYSMRASRLGKLPCRLLANLSKLREMQGMFKYGVDFFKGIFSTLFLLRSPDKIPELKYDVNNLDVLLAWLEASGEFKQEVKRLKKWRDYLNKLPYNEASSVISASVTFADWFHEQSREALGVYTRNVDQFLTQSWPEHFWQEDIIFCGRPRVEYHLNMVGAEIMNRIYHSEFIKTKHKVLLLPTCMSKPAGNKCMAKPMGRGYICVGCSADCSGKRLSEFGKSFNLQVRLVQHESSIASTKTDVSLFDKDSGVIGVSCVLNLISGGWMLVEKGVTPQCVLLDYCGCKNHWDKEGITTCINEKQLLRVLEK